MHRPRVMRLYERVLRFALERPVAARRRAALLVVAARTCCYRALGSDLLPAMDEGGFILDYIMPAGSSLAETNRVLLGVEQILRDDAGSGEHVAPHRPATRPRRGHRSQHRRHLGQAEARPQARASTRSSPRCATRSTKQSRMLDVEFIQLLQDMIGDLTSAPEPIEIKLFSQDPDAAEAVGAAGRRRDQEDPGRGGRARTASRTPSAARRIVFTVDPVVAARAGFTPQEIELDASAILQGEPAPTPVVVNDRAYTIRVRFPESTRAIARRDPATRCSSARPARPRTLGIAGRRSRRSRARPKSAARTCSATSR